MRVVVLASGRGSNLGALICAERDGRLPIRIVGVCCDREDAGALEIARASGIQETFVDPRGFARRQAFDSALFDQVARMKPDLIVLAGFMRILDPAVLTPWLGRIINIHPSLLPDYPGLNTHRRALEAGDSRHGASVHFVTAQLDGGPVLGQVVIDIVPGDTPRSLAERLLPREHCLLVACVGLLARARVRWAPEGVQLDGEPLANPLQLGDDGRFAGIRD